MPEVWNWIQLPPAGLCLTTSLSRDERGSPVGQAASTTRQRGVWVLSTLWEWDRAHSFPQQRVGCWGLPLYLRGLYHPKCYHDSHITLCLLCSCTVVRASMERLNFTVKFSLRKITLFVLEWTEKYLTCWLLQMEIWEQGSNLKY